MFQGLRPVEVLGEEVTDVLFPGHPINNQLMLMHPVLNETFCFDTLGSEKSLANPSMTTVCATAGESRRFHVFSQESPRNVQLHSGKSTEATELRDYEATSAKLRYYSATVDSQNCSLRSLPVVVATAKVQGTEVLRRSAAHHKLP